MLFSDQMELFSQGRAPNCVRGAVGTCLAPCATACSRVEYGDRIEAAVAFLTGSDVAVLDRMQAEMKSASGNRRFELAARLRDAHQDLARLSTFLQQLRKARRQSCVYPARGRRGKESWYLIREGQIMGVEQGPRNSRTSARCLKALDAVFPRHDREQRPIAPEDLDVVLLVARWFRDHPGELEAILSPEEARGRCG
jgi:excinuclease ABC subunit C